MNHPSRKLLLAAVGLLTVANVATAGPVAEPVNRGSVMRVRSVEDGTAFVIMTEGRLLYLLTAGHVVSSRTPGPAPPCEVDFVTNGHTIPCKVVDAWSKERDGLDLAVLEADAANVPGALASSRLGDSGKLPDAGVAVYTYGFPRGGGLRRISGKTTGASGPRLALSGIVPEAGQSGSPIFDAADGSVIGMITERARGTEEQSAIEIDMIRFFLVRDRLFRSFFNAVQPPASAVGPLVASDLGPTLTSMFSAAVSPERWYERSKHYARTDYELPRLPELKSWLGIKRVYSSSQSERIGAFGRGWGTALDYRVDTEKSNFCKLYLWNPQGIRVALDTVADCADAKRGLTSEVSDPAILDLSVGEMLSKSDLADRVLPGGPSYVGADYSVARARFVPNGIELDIGTLRYIFNSRGRLRQLSSGGRNLDLEYDAKDRISAVRDGQMSEQFDYTGRGRVSHVRFSDGSEYDYDYDAHDNLHKVSTAGHVQFAYGYDAANRLNIVQCGENPKDVTQISYNDQGRREMAKRHGKEYRWKFIDDQNGTPSVEQKFLAGGKVETRNYTFDADERRLDLQIDGDKRQYFLTQCLCLPLKVVTSAGVYEYKYDVFGRLTDSKTPVGEMRRGYDNKANKINSLDRFTDGKWKNIARATYDDNGNLVKVEGAQVTLVLTYRRAGQISSIKNAADGQTVELEYNAGGKPSRITLLGTGSINVTYKPDMSIEKVDSVGGPDATIKISGLFSRLLDAISPFSDLDMPDTEFDLLTAEPDGCRACSNGAQL